MESAKVYQGFVGSDKLKICIVSSHHTKQRVYMLYKCFIRLTLCVKDEII